MDGANERRKASRWAIVIARQAEIDAALRPILAEFIAPDMRRDIPLSHLVETVAMCGDQRFADTRLLAAHLRRDGYIVRRRGSRTYVEDCAFRPGYEYDGATPTDTEQETSDAAHRRDAVRQWVRDQCAELLTADDGVALPLVELVDALQERVPARSDFRWTPRKLTGHVRALGYEVKRTRRGAELQGCRLARNA